MLGREEVASQLQTSREGLTPDEAERRLVQYGHNILEETPPPSVIGILLHQFRSPLIYILVIASLATLLLGDYIDSAVIAFVLLLNAVIGFIQEYRAEHSVRALMQLVSPHARVIRGGKEIDIESRQLVPGDVVLLESGTRVPADLRLISATTLMVDESLLTGESVPVNKRVARLTPETPLADRVNMTYTGSIVTSGRGRGFVVETGARTELGKIAQSIRERESPDTPLQRRMSNFAKTVALVIGIAALATFAIGLTVGQTPKDMFMVAVALAVAAIPEGLPVVLTITLALSVRRMAARNALVRRLPAVETLGSTNVIGSDKTGTLTENRMTVQEIRAGGERFEIARESEGELPYPLFQALLTGILTNEANLQVRGENLETQGDPTEAALLIAAHRSGVNVDEMRARYSVVAEVPFEPDLQYSASLRELDGEQWMFVKGAPERVAAMCDSMLLGEQEIPLDKSLIHQDAREMAADGLRVLALAYRKLPEPLDIEEGVPEPASLVFAGLAGMLDPPREGVKEAILGCREAGIRVVMITGDHADTARAIGKQLGIGAGDSRVLTGNDLDAMSDEDLSREVREVSIFARVTPQHKHRVVTALQSHGQVVAVTGDGVNDAPALRAADIGVAMGKSGTDVAREAADIVLADDNFVTIYAAVEEGRVTFQNVRNVTFFLISTGAAAIIALLTALALGWPLPMLPAQLLWLNLVTNGLQDVALAFEPGDKNVLKQPPRSPKEGIISTFLWERTLLVGITIAVGVLLLFKWELDQTGSVTRAQTVALCTMVLFQNFHVGNSRSEYRSVFALSPFANPFLLIAALTALTVHIAALYLPFTQFVLRVEPIELDAWFRIVMTGLSVIVVVELHKWLRGKHYSQRQSSPTG